MDIREILKFPDDWVNHTKLHLATGATNKREPLYEFYKDKFQEWQNSQNQKNFEKDYIFSLIYYGKHEWLFAGIFQTKGLTRVEKKYYYQTELTPIGKEFIGRLIVRFEKNFRASYPHLSKQIGNLELLEILRDKYTVEPFPGFENIKISFGLLKAIIDQEEKTWRTALTSVKGIYLIADTSNGKLYIGAARGIESIWQRWKDYTSNGHGGNVELKNLIANNGPDYTNNFQYSLLETRSMNTDDAEISKRESFWKDIILSRAFGYNKN